jgi:hypothetical protein
MGHRPQSSSASAPHLRRGAAAFGVSAVQPDLRWCCSSQSPCTEGRRRRQCRSQLLESKRLNFCGSRVGGSSRRRAEPGHGLNTGGESSPANLVARLRPPCLIVMASDEIIMRQAILLIFRRAFDMAPSFEIFWTALSERRGELELGRGRSQRQDSFGHEPALVARCRSPAKLLLGFPKFVGIPRCSDHRRCHPCCWHSQGGPAALASCRTSEQLRRLGVLTSHSCRSRASTCVFRPRF